MDMQQAVAPDLNLDFLEAELYAYPAPGLYSRVVRGTSLEADVELQTVLVPHPPSSPNWYASVAKELRQLKFSTWYDFFSGSLRMSPHT